MPELAWFAGLFEGEGTVRINKPTRRNHGALCVSVVNTDREIVEAFQERWPGYFKQAKPASPRHRQPWVWLIASRQALEFLDAIEPYVVRSRERARIQLARDFQQQKTRTGQNGQRTTAYRRLQLDFYWRMRELNARGSAPAPQRPAHWDAHLESLPERWPTSETGNLNAKLSAEQRREIGRRRVAGALCRELAEEFDISTTRVSQLGIAYTQQMEVRT